MEDIPESINILCQAVFFTDKRLLADVGHSTVKGEGGGWNQSVTSTTCTIAKV